MMRSSGKRRWGFRTRLTALIAAVFITGGTALLLVQYFLVQQLFTSAIGTIGTGCFGEDGSEAFGGPAEEPSDIVVDCDTVTEIPGTIGVSTVTADSDGYSVFVQQSALLSEEVLSGLLLWSVVILVVFTAVAVLTATWLSRRSFNRIAQITETTKTITRSDLHQRLELPGPEDEIKELGDTIDTMLDRLQDSFTRQERFIANASHELRTPLTTNRTALEIPLQRGLVPEELKPSIGKALAANERSEALISALLILARSTSASHAEVAASHARDLSEILTDGLAAYAEAASTRSITIEKALSGPLPVNAGDVLLDLAVANLLDNAIRHNTDGGRIWVRTRKALGTVHLEVSNTGTTLTDEDAALLAEPFNRGTQTRLTSDSHSIGLGLTLVETIVEAHGGALTVSARTGGGLTCRVELPLVAPAEAMSRA